MCVNLLQEDYNGSNSVISCVCLSLRRAARPCDYTRAARRGPIGHSAPHVVLVISHICKIVDLTIPRAAPRGRVSLPRFAHIALSLEATLVLALASLARLQEWCVNVSR